MNSFTTLTVSASPRLVERPLALVTRHDSKNSSHPQTSSSGKHQGSLSRFLTTLLQSLSSWSV